MFQEVGSGDSGKYYYNEVTVPSTNQKWEINDMGFRPKKVNIFSCPDDSKGVNYFIDFENDKLNYIYTTSPSSASILLDGAMQDFIATENGFYRNSITGIMLGAKAKIIAVG